MGKLQFKDLIKEHAWDHEFGQPLATIKDTTIAHTNKSLQAVTESKKDSRYYINMLDTVKSNLQELMEVGVDYGIFQSAQYTAKAIKKAYKILDGAR